MCCADYVDMNIVTPLIGLLSLLPLITAVNVTIRSGYDVTYGNCTGSLDYFLCNCTMSATTIHIRLTTGKYKLSGQPLCALHDKISFNLVGESSTSIECVDFNIILMASSNVFISNIEMINCGDVVSDSITQSISKAVPIALFGNGIRFAIMLFQVTNVSLVNVTMRDTLGYGIVAFNALGAVNLIEVNVINTTFKNDRKNNCSTFDYDQLESKTNYSCSGSGILFLYHDILNDSLTNTDLVFNKCTFQGNKNILPTSSVNAYSDALNSGYYQEPLPLLGAGSITLIFTQSTFNGTLECQVLLCQYSLYPASKVSQNLIVACLITTDPQMT